MSTSININDLPALDAYFAKYVADIVVEEHDWPAYTKSMDAVLPWLAHQSWQASKHRDGRVSVLLHYNTKERPYPEKATAPTLPHAAVVALLRAKGVTVEEEKT